jgi:uncharacterized protein (DUF488 family)
MRLSMFAESGAAVYTLGCGAMYLENIAKWLECREVEYLIDLRNPPYDITRPELEPENFEAYLRSRGTKYLDLSEQLGDRPRDVSLFLGRNKIDYRKYRKRPQALEGIDRIMRAYEMRCRVCIFGRVEDPVQSHRARLVGQVLHERGVQVRHLLHFGSKLMTHDELLRHLWNVRQSIDVSYSSG